MAYIKVNLGKVAAAVSAVDTYVKQHKSKMESIDQAMADLGNQWQGADYQQVNAQWREMRRTGSTSANMLKSLENYADSLHNAGKAYKDAAERAVSRANVRCK